MVALSRCIAPVVALLAGVQGARVAKRRASASANYLAQNTKFIAGVPVLNYHAAYGGKGVLFGVEETVEEEWIVMMKPGSTDAQIDSLCKSTRNGCKMVGHPDKKGVAFFDMQGTEADLEAVIKRSNGAVKAVEPNQVVLMVPELEPAPASAASWGLDRVGANGRNGNLGAGVNIYILDTGVRTTHQDFDTRASPAVDYSGANPIECNGDLECAKDNQGHGTHCAGTAAGTTYGVASQANVFGVKVLGDDGAGGLVQIIGSIDYLATSSNRPAIGSMSLGGQCPLGFCGLLAPIKDAVDSAVASGVTIVVAGGNSNSDACGFMPAFVPAAITVGSTDSEDVRSYFSNYGSCTDIWAPGSAITSASHEDDSGAKTFSGTSMACPHVAGGAALVLEQNPGFVAEQVLDALLSNAATNYITDLKPEDVNKMLYIASDAPPPKGDVPAPPAPECPGYCFLCITPGCAGCC